MNKKILWYALGINIATSFLGALLYKYFCNSGQLYCGDLATSHLEIFFPTVISGTIFIAIAFLLALWLKRLWWLFFVITVVLAVMFNTGGETFKYQYEVAGALPSIIAVVAGWFLGKGKKSENATPAPTTPSKL